MKETEFDDFAAISLATYNLKSLNLDSQTNLRALTLEIESEFIELNTSKTKEARVAFFKIPNTSPKHYTEHLIQIPGKGQVICGIRHFNSLRDKPFVNILTSFNVTKEALLKLYKEFLQGYFSLFNPQYLRHYTSQEIASNQSGVAYLVQKAAVIKKDIIFEAEATIELVSPQSSYYYNWYLETYQLFHKENPTLAQSVPFNGKELMEESRQAGLLKEVIHNKEVIGLIAAISEPFLGQKGIYFIDLLLKKQWRKKGFAKAIQRKYINENTSEDEIVWGIIDRQNKPSLNTALANLRTEVRYENFIALD